MVLASLNGFRSIALALAAILFCTCSCSASVQRRSGPPVEAWFESSDSDNLHLTSENGEHVTVPRSDVVDIDHPGNVVLTAGIVAAALGTFLLVSASSNALCSRGSSCLSPETRLAQGLGGVALISTSIPMVVGGWWSYRRSIKAAAAPPPLPVPKQAKTHDVPRLSCSFCIGRQ